ncbi:MAG: AAA family ATPase [Chitinophagales bacterium]|nr:AAA family ATPase [Chitinophagales bacterium]
MNFIDNVQIKNFKSIKQLSFTTKRVNIFVGKPNVGKSNILEALSLFCGGYISSEYGFLKPFIRFNSVQELFHRKDIREPIFVDTEIGTVNLAFYNADTYFFIIDPLKVLAKPDVSSVYSDINETKRFFDGKYQSSPLPPFHLKHAFHTFSNVINHNAMMSMKDIYFYSPIKRYIFKEFNNQATSLFYPHSLLVPYGQNIVTILNNDTALFDLFAEIFKNEYNLDLTIKDPEYVLEILIREGYRTTSTPINLVADTLQRIMFYLTAIKSNTDSVLLFEEPEAHSFPTYTNMLADHIANDKKNQYFITTHSPYLLRTLLDETPKDEIGIFITTYKDYQTQLHALTEDDISELLDYNIDLFYNYKKFVD